jgi:hypothetical protein
VAAAFRVGTVTTTFRGYATEVAGTSRLQFAELRQEESFERRDSEAVLWGALALPDVVVEARAPVTYTYFLDLDKEWRFRLEGRDVLVVVPPVEWNRPSVDVSALRFEVREGSVLRDEQLVLDRLRGELTPLLDRRARQHVPLVREAGAAQGRGVRRDLARAALRRRQGYRATWCSPTSPRPIAATAGSVPDRLSGSTDRASYAAAPSRARASAARMFRPTIIFAACPMSFSLRVWKGKVRSESERHSSGSSTRLTWMFGATPTGRPFSMHAS